MSEARRGRRMPFVIMPWAVLDDDSLTAHDVLVYATIARYADVTTGVAWPSRATVAQNARCDIKTVDRSVTRLVAAGFLEKHKRRNELGESNVYVVHEIVARQETLEKRRPSDSNGAGGRGTNGAPPRDSNGGGTRTIELEETDPSDWTPMPDSVRAMLRPPDTPEAA
ncbi:MAG TPA: helix-turn-helix domain-containing protein [Acidimicrobiia bacterium]